MTILLTLGYTVPTLTTTTTKLNNKKTLQPVHSHGNKAFTLHRLECLEILQLQLTGFPNCTENLESVTRKTTRSCTKLLALFLPYFGFHNALFLVKQSFTVD